MVEREREREREMVDGKGGRSKEQNKEGINEFKEGHDRRQRNKGRVERSGKKMNKGDVLK
jgi:hypothetical protein